MNSKTNIFLARALLAGVALSVASSLSAATWIWKMSGIHGGGMGQVIAIDPVNANFATIGGDSWGVYNTTNAGNQWFAATKGLGRLNQQQPTPGDFFFMGMAYSRKFPGRVYCLTGRLEDASQGNFGYVSGNSYTVITRAIRGGETTASGGTIQTLPRPTGKRVVVDYVNPTEYIYVGTGAGGGVARTSDAGATWQTIGLSGLGSAITGMCLDPANHTTLYVATRGNKTYRLTNIRGAVGNVVVTQLANSPQRVDEISAIGTGVYAAANTSGIYKVTNSGTTWSPLGGTMFTSTGSPWGAVGGTGNTIYVGCAYPAAGKSIAKSTNGGSSWTWVTNPGQVHLQVWGRSEDWWLGVYQPNTLPGNGTYLANQIEVDAFDSDIVYVSGRSGCWKSIDGGANWRPAMNGLGGTMHNHIKAASSGAQAWTDDVDWNGETTSNHFFNASQQDPPAFDTPTLDLTKGGHRYQLIQNVVRDFKVDGVSIADEFFRATCITATDIDVSADGNYIYVAQFGGGVLVAHKSTAPWP